MDEKDSTSTCDNDYSFAHEVGIPDVTDGLWRSHDAFTDVVRRIMTDRPENMEALLQAACDEQCAHNKKLLSKVCSGDGGMDTLGYDDSDKSTSDK